MPEVPSSSPESSNPDYKSVYRAEIERSLLAGEVQTALELADAQRLEHARFKVTKHSRVKGNLLRCDLDVNDFHEAQAILSEGADLKLVTADDAPEDYSDDDVYGYSSIFDTQWYRPGRKKKKKKKKQGDSSVMDAKFLESSGYPWNADNPFLKVQLETRAELKKNLSIRPVVNMEGVKAPFAMLSGMTEKVREAEYSEDDFTQRFLHGDFNIPEGELASNPKLDDSQNRAYGMAMAYEDCPYLFLQGGPGSGKTTIICEITKGHIEQGRNVLVLSHSNRGAQVPALKLKEDKVKVHIAGNDPDMVDTKLHRDRIKRKLKFPEEKMRAINNLSDEEVTEKVFGHDDPVEFCGKQEPAVLARKMMKDEVKKEYEAQQAKVEGRFRRSMKNGGVAFSTLGTLYTDEILAKTKFDVVIVDEATRFHAPDLLLALKNAGKQIIFVGDPKQLGNIPLSPDEANRLHNALNVYTEREFFVTQMRQKLAYTLSPQDATKAVESYNEGPFSSIISSTNTPEKDLPYVFLDQDRRSLPNVVRVLSDLIYDGKLKPGRAPKENEGEGLVRFLDTSGASATEKVSGTSRKNTAEAEQIVRKVLDKIFEEGASPEDIAIIATYKAQADLIKKRFKARLYGNERNRELYERIAANVDTVDAFQGSERNIVFTSLTRSFDSEKEQGSVGFLEEQRRIGVAIGRARDELYVVGDLSTVVDRNKNEESKAFFTRMRDAIAQYGQIEAVREGGGRRRRRSRGKARKMPRKRLR